MKLLIPDTTKFKGPDMKAYGIGFLAIVLVGACFLATVYLFPHSAIAFVSKNSSCVASSCHGTTISGATLTTGINGTQTSSVTVAAGGTFEVDYLFTGVANGSGVGVLVAVPTGWTLATGTANSTGLSGWNTAWNLSDGVTAGWTGGFTTATEYPNSPVGYTLDYAGTGWDNGNRNAAYDDGSAGDLDGTANRMGTDVRITVPAGTAGGTYQVVVAGIGHDSGGAKAHFEQVLTVTVPSPTTTTVGNGTNPGNATLAPGGALTDLDSFTLNTSTGTDTVTGLTVSLAAGTYAGISSVTITNNAGTTTYGTVTNPSSDTVNFATLSTNIPVTTTSTQYRVRIQPKTHANMPAVPGASYAVTGTVTSITCTNAKAYNDSGSATLTIDNLSTANPSSFSGSPGNNQVALTWSNPADADFSQVVVLRRQGSAITDTPVEGTTYTAPGTLGSSSIVYVGSATGYTDTGVTNGNSYYYEMYAKDSNGNYSSGGAAAGPYTPAAATCTANTPTLAVAPTSASVIAGAGMLYTVTVTNNDSGASCSNVTFNLSLGNSNTTDFSTTAISPTSLSIAPGGQGSATFTVTAGAAAPDGAQNSSTVGVTATGHSSPANVAAITTVNSTNSPLMHSGANLGTKYAGGTWGAGKDCTWCHTAGSTNIKLVNTSIDTSTGARSVVFNRLTSSVTTATGLFGNDERSVQTVSSNVCEVCHHSTDFHQYSSVTKPSGKSVLSTTHNNRTDCMSCHPHSTGFKGSGCDGCHGNPPTTTAIGGPDGLATPATGALGASPTNAGAHNAHVNALSMTCYTCHTGNTMPTVSNSIQLGFAVNAATWPAYRGNSITYGSFSGHTPLNAPYGANGMVSSSAGTIVNNSASYRNSCNVYCHGQWTGSNGSLNPSWIITNGTQDACGTCHSTAQTTYAAGSHQRHTGTNTGSGQLNLACTECHGTLPANNSHVNGQVHTQLNTANTKFGSSATYKGFANQSSAAFSYGSCAVYCHSAVQNSTGTALVTPTPSANWGTAGPLTCSTSNCHGNPPANNAHAVHTGAPYSYACSACHTGAGQGTASHANYAINMAINATYGATATYTAGAGVTPGSAAAFGTCNTNICHGQQSPVWASPSAAAQCHRCHGSKATAFGNFSSPQVAPGYSTDGVDTGGNNAATSARVGAHQAHLQATDSFTDKIHCGECHTVVTSVTQASHLNYSTATMTFGAVAKAQSHTPTVTRAGGVISCSTTYCHTGKLNSGAAPTPAWNNTAYLPATISLTACGQCHGFPPSTGSGHPAATAPSGFPVGSNCSCHTNLSSTATTYAAIFTDKTKHVNGTTESAGCDGCHGDPPTTTAIGGPNGLATPATGALGASPTNAGAHNAHVNSRSMTCSVCHTGNTMPTVSNSIQMGFVLNAANWPAYRGNSITYGSFSGHTPLNAPYGASGMVSSSAGTLVNNSASYRNSCNVYCHGQWTGSNGSLNPSWIITNGTQDACGTCHSTAQTTYAAGSHQRHTGTNTGSGQLNLACTECHGTLPANNDHVNGQVHTQLNTANTKFGSSATYKGFANQSSAAFSYGSCAVYCHSAVQNSTGTALVTPTPSANWGTAGPLTCSTSNCHGNPPANNAHAVHTGAPYSYACSACHTGAGQGTASHANYAINMAMNATYGATATYTTGASVTPGSAAAFGTCNTTICHGQRSPVWASPTTPTGGQCVRCHGSKATAFGNFSSPQVAPGYSTDGVDTGGNNAATSARVGAHQAHLQATDSFTDKIHCGECHTVVTSVAQASHLNYTSATMTFGAVAKAQSHTPTATRSGGVISCSATYCHTGKLNSGAAMTPAWNNTAYLPATISLTACGQCHGFPPSTGSGHPAATAPTGFPVGGNCNCHTNLSTTATTYATIFTDKTKHINGTAENASGCKACHGTGSAKDVQTEFGRNSHHTNKTWANIADADCVVCHAEGTISGGTVSTTPSRHGGETGTKGVVDLYNADNRATIYTITLADLTNRVNAANATLDTFCMSCHDSGGAVAVTTGNGFPTGYVATNPFKDTTISNGYDQQTRTFGAAPAPLNVYDAFAPTNNSHHAVRIARYTKTTGLLFGQSLTQAGLLSTTAANYSGGTGFTDMSVMHCNDCHSTAFSAHGGNNEYLLQTATSDNPPAEHASDTEYVCLKCHPNYAGGGSHTGSGSDFIHSADLTGTARSSGNDGHITGIACLNCHDGAVGFGGVHGVPNATYTAGVGGSGQGTYNKRRFLPGSGLRYYDPSATHTSSTINDDGTWGEATATNQCYTLGTANTTSSCTKHGSKAAGMDVRNVRRPVTY